jgi:hypothetical protein
MTSLLETSADAVRLTSGKLLGQDQRYVLPEVPRGAPASPAFQ